MGLPRVLPTHSKKRLSDRGEPTSGKKCPRNRCAARKKKKRPGHETLPISPLWGAMPAEAMENLKLGEKSHCEEKRFQDTRVTRVVFV